MSKLFIGCKVRHSLRGETGRVAEFDENDPLRMTVGVAVDGPGVGYDGEGIRKVWGSGEVVFDYPFRWIPIVDRHAPAEKEFTESLDKLLSEVRHASVE